MILVNSVLYDKVMTSAANQVNEFCVLIPSMRTNHLRTIAITHKQFPLDLIGTLHIAPDERNARIEHLKNQLQINELVYISTCNRVEFVFTLDHYVCPGFAQNFLQTLFPSMEKATAGAIAGQCERYNEGEAMEHLLRVSSSLDSMVIGEREIITQMRLSYEDAEKQGWAGDQLRLAWKQILKTSKEIYTHTDLAKLFAGRASARCPHYVDRRRSNHPKLAQIPFRKQLQKRDRRESFGGTRHGISQPIW
jgi:glutamyl-tRNA reductase